jgi:hypothetical protein
MVKSPKTGAYIFQEEIVENELEYNGRIPMYAVHSFLYREGGG